MLGGLSPAHVKRGPVQHANGRFFSPGSRFLTHVTKSLLIAPGPPDLGAARILDVDIGPIASEQHDGVDEAPTAEPLAENWKYTSAADSRMVG